MRVRSRRVGLALAAALSATVLLSCGGSGLGDANFFSLEDEWKLGEQLERDIARQLELVRDPEALRLLNALGRQVVDESRFAELPWEFHVVRDDSVNAFNIPGGHVYVNTGLIEAADDASEFMGVLAHEIAHGVERHATQQVSQAYGLQVLLAMALGNDAGALQQLAANIAGGGILSHYSREKEREADAVGLQLMAAAGYDPNGMVRFFEKLLEIRQRRPNKVEQFFSSHPLTETRISAARERIAAMSPDGRWTTESELFRALERQVR